jgi:hypothetical protein
MSKRNHTTDVDIVVGVQRVVHRYSDEINALRAQIDRLRNALSECAADYESPPGTVMSTAGHLAREFIRRQQLAADALADERVERGP